MEKSRFYNKIIKTFDRLSGAEKKRIFEDLYNSFNYVNVIFENLEEGIIALDQTGIIKSLNKQAAFLLNIPLNSVDKKIDDITKEISFKKIFFDEKEGKKIVHDEKASRFLEINILPIGEMGSIIGSIIKIIDITEIYEREQRLKRAEQLASLTTLAAGVAHEIKNPLGSISIYIQLIEKVLSTKETHQAYDEIKEYCDIVKEEILRLEETINSFLFSVRSIDLQKIDKNIKDLILSTLSFLKYEIEEKNIEVDINFEDDNLILNIDERYIKQAIINIIQNAIDALESVAKKELNISVKKNHKYAIINIKDKGIGIRSDDIGKLFEPYYTTKRNGTGLGLTNVARIIEAHNGKITVTSNPNSGTEFIIKLPLVISIQKYLISDEF